MQRVSLLPFVHAVEDSGTKRKNNCLIGFGLVMLPHTLKVVKLNTGDGKANMR
jgi:hypothetical protein